MRKYLLALVALFLTQIGKGQMVKDEYGVERTEFTNPEIIMNEMFENVSMAEITSGYLMDKSRWLIDFRELGGKNASKIIDNFMQKRVYGATAFACVSCDESYMNSVELENYVNQFQSNEIPLSIALIDYHTIKEDAIDQAMFTTSDYKLYDAARRGTPYEQGVLFSAGVMHSVYKGSQFSLIIDEELFISNKLDQNTTVYIDINDGLSYQEYSIGDEIQLDFYEDGENLLKVKLIDDREVYEVQVIINVDVPEQRRSPGNTTESDLFYDGEKYATITTLLGCDQVLDKPLILVEGFDNGGAFDYESMMTTFGVSHIVDGPSNGVYYQGYDLIHVDFTNSNRSIIENAQAVKQLIKQVNNDMIGNGQMVVIGASMGGLISRVTLLELEDENYDHNVKTLVCKDSPHQGAYIPLGLQAMTMDFAYLFATTGIGWIDLAINESKSILMQALTLNSPSVMQMLREHVNPAASIRYNELRNHLASLGNYPSQCRNVAFIDGSMNGSSNPMIAPGDKIFDMGKNVLVARLRTEAWSLRSHSSTAQDIYKNKAEIFTIFGWIPIYSSRATAKGKPAYESLPGGTWYTMQSIVNGVNGLPSLLSLNPTHYSNPSHCFVPSLSAIDYTDLTNTNIHQSINSIDPVANNKTPFDAIYGENSNSRHVRIESMTPATELFMHNELGFGDIYLQDDYISNNTLDIQAIRSVEMGKYVAPSDHGLENNAYMIHGSVSGKITAGGWIKMKEGTRFDARHSGKEIIIRLEDLCDGLPAQRLNFNVITEISEEEENEAITSFNEHSEMEQLNFESKAFSVYPNPATDHFNVELTGDDALVKLTLVNHLGQVVYEYIGTAIEGNNIQVETSNFDSGVYLINVEKEGVVKSQKVVIHN